MRKLLLTFVVFSIIGTSFNNISAALVIPTSIATEDPDPATVKAALAAFKSLPKKERKTKIKEVKKEIKLLKQQEKLARSQVLTPSYWLFLQYYFLH
jgi:hypothetical protein